MAEEHIAPPVVFISYSHESTDHKRRVLGLANRLRLGGIDAGIDQFIHSPPQGWPHWCHEQIDAADFVLVICTETYERRFWGREKPGKGQGSIWEGAIITLALYQNALRNSRFVPVVFSSADQKYVPSLLAGGTVHDLSKPEGFDQLYRRLTGQPEVIKEDLGEIKWLPPISSREPLAARGRSGFGQFRHDFGPG